MGKLGWASRNAIPAKKVLTLDGLERPDTVLLQVAIPVKVAFAVGKKRPVDDDEDLPSLCRKWLGRYQWFE